MARTSTPSRQRISIRNPAAKVRTIACVERASRTHASDASRTIARKIPRITISGAWLRAAGFKPGKPCLVRAFARRQLVVCQPD